MTRLILFSVTEAVIQNGSGPDKQQKYPQQYTHVSMVAQ